MTIRIRLFLFAIAATAALVPSQRSALAAEPADTSSEAAALTLEQAVALGLERTAQLQAQSAAIDAAQAESIAAGRLPDPELVIGVDNLPATGDVPGRSIVTS